MSIRSVLAISVVLFVGMFAINQTRNTSIMGPKALKVRGNRAENQENGKKVVVKNATNISLLYFSPYHDSESVEMDKVISLLNSRGWTIGEGEHIQLMDFDKNNKYEISRYPCIIRIKNQKETNRYYGYIPANKMKEVWEGKQNE
jgi:hypothetical protein